MNEHIMKLIKENFAWVKDIVIVLGMCGVLYLNLNYVTTNKFDSFVASNDIKYNAIQAAIVSLDKSLALLQQNNKVLSDNQFQIAHMNDVLNDVVQQNKSDAALTKEFRDFMIKYTVTDNALSQLQSLDIGKHIKEEYQRSLDIEYRLKMLEGKISPTK